MPRASTPLCTIMHRSLLIVGLFLALCSLVPMPGAHAQQTAVEAFDGSFRLETGETITGGYFVEDAEGRFLYMDTENLEKGGLFERVSATLLRSVVPPGAVEIEFLARTDGSVNALLWREQGEEPIRGARVYPHESRSVRFASEDGTELQGRLLLPQCPGSHPAVVSVHGSGPVDRHGGPYHTFFLKHGVAVLAYDKRGYTADVDSWREPDLATLSADAAAALRFAATVPEIDSSRLGFFGASQAGWVVPRAAVEASATEFIILRAGAAVSYLETVFHEIRQDLRADSLHGLELDYAMDLRREVYELALAGEPLSATDALVAPYLEEPWYRAAFGEGPISGHWSADGWTWMQRNLTVSATPYLRTFDGRVLWFLAELDENVPLVPTRAALEGAFRKARGDDHEIVVLDGTSHSFQIHGSDRPLRFSDGFFDRMATWMRENSISDATCWGPDA